MLIWHLKQCTLIYSGSKPLQLSYRAAISLAAVICSTVFFIVGCVGGGLCLYLIFIKCKRRDSRDGFKDVTDDHVLDQPPTPLYEDVFSSGGTCKHSDCSVSHIESFIDLSYTYTTATDSISYAHTIILLHKSTTGISVQSTRDT